jgi:TPR repeat protein
MVVEVTGTAVAGLSEDATLAYEHGDYATALRLWRPLADQGNAEAQGHLGFLYAHGHGVPQDYTEAVRWYRKAADQGVARAQCNLGLAYHKGRGVPQDYADAMRWYRRAADQGHATAQYNLGLLYANGQGVPQDDAEAARWYRKSADQGNPEAQFNLGVMYANGQGIPQDNVQAYKWFNLVAARLSGETRDLAVKNRNIVAAKVLADATSASADGDYTTALRLLQPLADQCHAEAQTYVGVMYHQGQGAPQNTAEAARWYRKAAEQGYASAQNNLGVLYAYGQGVAQDHVAAYKWLSLAASRYSGADRDRAVKMRRFVAAKMTPEQIAEAQKLASEWKPK